MQGNIDGVRMEKDICVIVTGSWELGPVVSIDAGVLEQAEVRASECSVQSKE